MFTQKKLDELALMYRVFKRVESTLNFIINIMQQYITKRGEEIVSNQELLKDRVGFTQKLLELKKEIDKMVEKSFHNDIKF
jgi:hypothetical protein